MCTVVGTLVLGVLKSSGHAKPYITGPGRSGVLRGGRRPVEGLPRMRPAHVLVRDQPLQGLPQGHGFLQRCRVFVWPLVAAQKICSVRLCVCVRCALRRVSVHLDLPRCAVTLLLKIAVGGFAHFAPVCSSWVFISRSSTSRSVAVPEGTMQTDAVRTGNTQAARHTVVWGAFGREVNGLACVRARKCGVAVRSSHTCSHNGAA
jgi:hypothetical protein